jgi:ABC-type sugar transport system substrate-binding protein
MSSIGEGKDAQEQRSQIERELTRWDFLRMSGAGIAGTMLLGAVGCSGSSSSGGGGGSKGGTGPYIFLPKSLNNPYWADCKKGMTAEAKKLGVEAKFIGPDTPDPGKQVQLFENALAQNPSGIAISPNDPATVKATVDRATAQGIPVLAWDSPVPNSKAIAYIGTDNVVAGKKLAEALAPTIGKKGQIAILVGSLSAINAQQRIQGFKEGLKAYPDIEIVATQSTQESVSVATSQSENLLQAHPDLVSLVGITGSDATGCGTAVKEANKCGKVKVVGFDVVPQAVNLMQDGCIQIIISQKPYGMSALTLKTLYELHKGKKKPSDVKSVDTGTVLVTPKNLKEFMKKPH